MANFFTADTHFYHKNVIDYCKRPFADVDTMNRELIARWNAKVSPRDTVWFLGDFAMTNNRQHLQELFQALNGGKNLIQGNHDHKRTRQLNWAVWPPEGVYGQLDGVNVFMSHYPHDEWDGQDRGRVHLHGHTHGDDHRGELGPLPNRHDVGVDCWDYEPVTIQQVLAIDSKVGLL